MLPSLFCSSLYLPWGLLNCPRQKWINIISISNLLKEEKFVS